jgi:anti-anti-sigma factor
MHEIFRARRLPLGSCDVEVNLTLHDGYALAQTHGPLDDSTAAVFRDSLHPLFNERGVHLVVDIADSPRVNSEGLSAMVRLASDGNTRGGTVVFAAPSIFVREVLKVTRLDKFFDIAATTEEALTRLE